MNYQRGEKCEKMNWEVSGEAREPKGRQQGWDSWGGAISPLPQQLWSLLGLGERYDLYQRGPELSPGR